MTQHARTQNNVTLKGRGKQPIIFAPGFGFDQEVWAAVAKSFEDNYRVILFDYVGFGQSDITAYDPKKYSTISGYVEDVLAICKELALDNLIFVGHSVGSMIGMLASIQQPDLISKLIMIGPSPFLLNEGSGYRGGFEKEELDGLIELMEKNYCECTTTLSKAIMNGSDYKEFEREIEAQFRLNDPVITNQFAKVCFYTDYREQLKDVTVPTLIIQSSNDLFVPEEVAYYMKEMLFDCVLSYSSAVGHCSHISHPTETIHLIQNFLNEHFASELQGTGGIV